MSAFDSELSRRLRELEDQTLLRRLRRVSSPQQPHLAIEGQDFLNFSSNDYLGLATHPQVKQAALAATEQYGTGAGASRLISGSMHAHHALEDALASFKRTEGALVFSTGYAAALGTITALAAKDDILVLDKLVHASIVDAARLSGATLRIFHHNDANDLERILRWADEQRGKSPAAKILVVTESLFSMDGDIAPLREIVELKERFGAWLMVDEAHATALFGPNRRGLAEEFGVSERIEVQMGTLGKALGSAGGFIAGSRTLIDYLVNKARSFIFSTAPPPAVSAAAQAALELVQSAAGAQLLEQLRANIERLRTGGFREGAAGSPILPLKVGPEEKALELAARLRDHRIFVPAIRFPTVPRGKARLRFTVSSAHTAGDIERALEVLKASV